MKIDNDRLVRDATFGGVITLLSFQLDDVFLKLIAIFWFIVIVMVGDVLLPLLRGDKK